MDGRFGGSILGTRDYNNNNDSKLYSIVNSAKQLLSSANRNYALPLVFTAIAAFAPSAYAQIPPEETLPVTREQDKPVVQDKPVDDELEEKPIIEQNDYAGSFWLPGRPLADGELRILGGLGIGDNSGSLFGAEGAYLVDEYLIGGQIRLGKLDIDRGAFTGKESTIVFAPSIRGKEFSVGLNGYNVNRDVERNASFVRTLTSVPLLTQTTNLLEKQELKDSLTSMLVQYEPDDSFSLQVGISKRSIRETTYLNQIDRIQGLVDVPGFGLVTIDDLVNTIVDVNSRQEIRSVSFNFEKKIVDKYRLSEDFRIGMRNQFIDSNSTVKLNGRKIAGTNLDELINEFIVISSGFNLELGYRRSTHGGDGDFVGALDTGFFMSEGKAVGLLSAASDLDGQGVYGGGVLLGEEVTEADRALFMRVKRDLRFNERNHLWSQTQQGWYRRDLIEALSRGTGDFSLFVSGGKEGKKSSYDVIVGIPFSKYIMFNADIQRVEDHEQYGARFTVGRFGLDFSRDANNGVKDDIILLSYTIGGK